MSDLQKIPARHGVATFVPAGQTIKIINTSGTQRVDVWAFALPSLDGKRDEGIKDENNIPGRSTEEDKGGVGSGDTSGKLNKVKDPFPNQDDAEIATRETLAKEWTSSKGRSSDDKTRKSSLTAYLPKSYMPSLGFGRQTGEDVAQGAAKPPEQTNQEKDSRAWASYFPSGQAFSSTGRTWSSYIPKQASDAVSQFAATHQRDPSKSYLAQLQDFSRTPVGAAGLAKVTGSGYGSSLYAAYSAYKNLVTATAPIIEHLSVAHTVSVLGSLHLRVGNTLITNLRQPILTLVQDTSVDGPSKACTHDTLSPACDPPFYHASGIDGWAEHGSCAENLVLALKELNERAGLKGARAVGAQVTVNNCPVPLGLFGGMTVKDGNIATSASTGNAKDMVRLRAERDVVIVMSACPNDVSKREPSDAHFLIEKKELEPTSDALKRTMRPAVTKKLANKKHTAAASSQKTSGATSTPTAPLKADKAEETARTTQKTAENDTPPIKKEKSDVTQRLSGENVTVAASSVGSTVSELPATSKPSTPIKQKKTVTPQQSAAIERNPVPKAPPPRKQKGNLQGATMFEEERKHTVSDASEPKTPQVKKKPAKLVGGSKVKPTSASG